MTGKQVAIVNEQFSELDQEMKRQRRYFSRNLWIAGLLLIGICVYFFFSTPGVSIRLSETEMTLTIPDNESIPVLYQDITGVSLAETPDYGEAVTGERKQSYLYGMWRSDAWGTYTACVYEKTDCCVLIETTQGTVAVNYSGREETEALYQVLLEQSAAH